MVILGAFWCGIMNIHTKKNVSMMHKTSWEEKYIIIYINV
jgi:hypothetical protein